MFQKTLAILFFQIAFFSTVVEAGDLLYSPAFCDPQNLSLEIENKSQNHQGLWIQTRKPNDIHEKAHRLAPKSTLMIQGTDFLRGREPFTLKTLNRNAVKAKVNCEGMIQFSLNDSTSPTTAYALSPASKNIKFFILNLFPHSNSIKIKAFNSEGKMIEERKITLSQYFETQSFKWKLSDYASEVRVESENRINSVILIDDQGTEKRVASTPLPPTPLHADPKKTYFLVSTKSTTPEDAFVIALEEPAMIETAREQIKFRELEKIVVAGIELGHGGFNRAFLARDGSPYSWSVYRVDAFADFAYIDCDGSPDLTEERLPMKLNDGGRICFWRYRVVRELSLDEVNSGQLRP